MTHLLKALRKIRDDNGEGDPLTPEYLRGPGNATPDTEYIPAETAEIRPESRLVVWNDPQGLGADRYRMLRMQLERLRGNQKLKTILVTSPAPQDGKSTVALNLATVLAKHGKHEVLLLEADLRCPSLTRRLGLKPWPGLAECLTTGSEALAAVRQIDPLQFCLLPAGAVPEHPAELLQSERMTRCVEDLSKTFDWILIDSTPTSPITDALTLKSRADGCLLVARAGKTGQDEVAEAIQLLGPQFVLGIVLNGVKGIERRYAGYYENYYGRAQVESANVPGQPLP